MHVCQVLVPWELNRYFVTKIKGVVLQSNTFGKYGGKLKQALHYKTTQRFDYSNMR